MCPAVDELFAELIKEDTSFILKMDKELAELDKQIAERDALIAELQAQLAKYEKKASA